MDDRSIMHAMSIDDAYHVERVLARRNGCATELVTLNGAGPFVRRRIPLERAERSTWAALASCASDRLPHVIAMYDMPDSLTVITEYVPGETLERIVRTSGPLAPEEAAHLVGELCDAVSELHAHGVIHRDITPTNVVVNEGGAHLIDFGNARRPAAEARRDTTTLGTFGFAAPEQYGFAQTDARSDVYALGKLLEYALTGGAADDADTDAASPARADPRLKEVIDHACAFEPSARYQDVGAFQQAMRSALDAEESPAGRGQGGRIEPKQKPVAPISVISPATHGSHLMPRRAIAIAAPIVIVGSALAFLLAQMGHDESLDDVSGAIGSTETSTEVSTDAGDTGTSEIAAPSDETATPEIVESGWSVGSGPTLGYALSIKNPSDKLAMESPIVIITGRAKDGTILFTREQGVSPISPGETTHLAGSEGTEGTAPQTVEFSTNTSAELVSPDQLRVPTFSITDARAVKGDLEGITAFTGNLVVEGGYDATIWKSAMLCVVLRDAQGAIIYGWNTFADYSASGQKVPFQVNVWNVPTYDLFEIHASPWY